MPEALYLRRTLLVGGRSAARDHQVTDFLMSPDRHWVRKWRGRRRRHFTPPTCPRPGAGRLMKVALGC